MYGAALESVGYGVEFDVKGFLDDRSDALAAFAGYPPVIGSPDGYEIAADDVFVTALGSVASRRRCAEALEARGAEFVSVVHRTATIGPNVVIGAGSFIAPHVSLTADVSVGRHVSVFHSSSIGHDSRLGDFSHVYAQCSIGGSVVLGEDAAVVGAGSAVFVDVDPGVTVLGNPARPID